MCLHDSLGKQSQSQQQRRKPMKAPTCHGCSLAPARVVAAVDDVINNVVGEGHLPVEALEGSQCAVPVTVKLGMVNGCLIECKLTSAFESMESNEMKHSAFPPKKKKKKKFT